MTSVGGVPDDPPPSVWDFPPPSRFHPDDDLVATGADLEPGTVLLAYRRGLFPMPVGGARAPMAWFCPVTLGVLRPTARLSMHIQRHHRAIELGARQIDSRRLARMTNWRTVQFASVSDASIPKPKSTTSPNALLKPCAGFASYRPCTRRRNRA